MPKQYSDYRLTDFLTDENFKNWIKKGKPQFGHWHLLMLKNEDMKELMLQAEFIILTLSENQEPLSEAQQIRNWQTIEKRIDKDEQETLSLNKIKRLFTSVSRLVAVVAMIIASIGVCSWLYYHERKVYHQTGNGAYLSITLPDKSTVILGANSSLRYHANWPEGKVREVWVDGEAHFDVQHLHRDQNKILDNHRFIAHMNNHLQVEVLGTVFNVHNRRKKSSVELLSGSVAVSDKKLKLTLKPGETATFTKNNTLTKTFTNEALQYNWKEKELIMNQANVDDVLEILEDNFGKQISIESKTISSKKLDGAIPLVNEEETFEVLAAILNARIADVKNVIIIKENTITAE